MKYDVIVVGGGHAGCEAASAASRQGLKTALITSNINNIADMPCNPSIGGTAKGIVVREIDALGGLMGRVADISHLQIKMLNSGKGPAVKSLRAQGDKVIYPQNMMKELKSIETLDIIEAMVEDLIIENQEIKGIITETNVTYNCQSLILTTGTYLKSKILVGSTNKAEGPHGEKSSKHLSDKLKSLGFDIQRLKTGTPQRLDPETIDYSKFNRANLGIDLYSSRIQPELQKQIALTQKGLYIQAIDVQKLNSSAAINLYNPRTVQKNVELTQSINQGELIAPKVLKKSDNSINLSNITDSSKENGYNPFSSGHATDEKEGKSK